MAAEGELVSGSAWSTIKVPIALRILEDAGGPEGLTAEQDEQIRLAITASDNEAAAALFDGLTGTYGGVQGAADAVTEILREAGDDVTQVSTVGRAGFSAYGQTEWSLEAQHQFMSALIDDCIGNPDSNAYLLELMRAVTSDTWGLGASSAPALWKGGWGPGEDGSYLLRQMGVVELDGSPIVVALAVRSDNGTFESGQLAASELAQQVADAVPIEAGASAVTC